MPVPNLCPCPKCACGLNKNRTRIAQALNAGAQQPPLARLQELLKSNMAPNQLEQATMSAFMAHPLESIASIDSQIQHLQNAIQKLQVTRGDLVHVVADFQLVTQPIRRVPQDVLAEIFMILVESEFSQYTPTFTFQPSPDDDVSATTTPERHLSQNAAWTVSRVCSAWRRLAQSTPRLWSYLRVHWDVPAPVSYQQQQYYVVDQTHRTREERLAVCLAETLRFSMSFPLSLSLDNVPSRYLQMLSISAGRWREFHSDCCPEFRGVTSLPVLRILDVSWYGVGPFSLARITSTMAPELRTLLTSVPSSGIADMFPENQITEFVDVTTEVEDDYCLDVNALAFLKRQPRLRKCRLHITDTRAAGTALTLTRLEYLALSIHPDRHQGSSPPNSFLTIRLLAPNLTTLEVTGDCSDPDDVLTFVKRSGCLLTSLSYSSARISEQGCIKIIESFTSLVTLSLDDNQSNPPTFPFSAMFFAKLTVMTGRARKKARSRRSAPTSSVDGADGPEVQYVPSLETLILPKSHTYPNGTFANVLTKRPSLRISAQT